MELLAHNFTRLLIKSFIVREMVSNQNHIWTSSRENAEWRDLLDASGDTLLENIDRSSRWPSRGGLLPTRKRSARTWPRRSSFPAELSDGERRWRHDTDCTGNRRLVVPTGWRRRRRRAGVARTSIANDNDDDDDLIRRHGAGRISRWQRAHHCWDTTSSRRNRPALESSAHRILMVDEDLLRNRPQPHDYRATVNKQKAITGKDMRLRNGGWQFSVNCHHS